jgi:hypothetical protein
MNSVLTPLLEAFRDLLAGRMTGAQVLEAFPELQPIVDGHGGVLTFARTLLPALERAVLGSAPDPEYADVLQTLAVAAVERARMGFEDWPEYDPEVRQRLETMVQAIVDALQAVVPSGVTLAREGLRAGVMEHGGLTSSTTFVQEVDAGGISAFVWSLTSLVQDHVSEETTWPWPSYPGDPTSMALPDSAVEGGVLRIWFGDERSPMIACTPISLDGVL